MLYRVVEIYEENRFISLNRGFMEVYQGKTLIGKVPLDDIGVLILSAQGISLTKNIINGIAENGGITIFCGKNYHPETMALPQYSHYLFSKIVKSQIECSVPIKKRIWQQIVINKIKNQSLVLKRKNKIEDSKKLDLLINLVKSGDSDNKEAQAAKIYFKSLFGKDFIRDKNEDGINSLLNYGYAIMRASMARAICAAGLIPSLGIHHDNCLNQFCLVDDLFEIYRPIVDDLVYELSMKKKTELFPEIKKELTNILWVKVKTEKGYSPAFQSMQYMASSYVSALENKTHEINVPIWTGGEE